jgi:hypothetical protein
MMKIKTKKYVDNQIRWLEKVTDAKFKAMNRAVNKIEKVNDHKFESQNEWRG